MSYAFNPNRPNLLRGTNIWFLLVGAVVIFVPAFLLLRGDGGPGGDASPGNQPIAIHVPAYGERQPLPKSVADPLANGDVDAALAQLQVALSDPTMKAQAPRLMLAQIRVLESAGKHADADAAAGVLLTQHPSTPYAGDALGVLAERARGANRMDEARDLWQKICDNHPQSTYAAVAQKELAKLAAKSGDPEQALRAYSALLMRPMTAAERAPLLAEVQRLSGEVVYSGRKMQNARFHEVKRGDTVGKIAKRFKSSVGLLSKVNQLKGHRIYVGQKLKVLSGDFTIVVHKSLHQLTLFIDGVYLEHWPVGLGEHGGTPLGSFEIITKLKNPDWFWEGRRIPYGDPRHKIGTRWMGFRPKANITGYGIHGTDEPESIGKNMSAGCVRLHNDHVQVLFEMVPRGTRVDIVR